MPRSLVACIIAFALPLQGYAAAAMIACGPIHGTPAAVADASASPHHGDCDRHAPTPAKPAKPAQGECSACASCCTAPAATSPHLEFSVLPAAHAAAIPFRPLTPETVVPDGLERPPRASLA
jgi:hypothetical protein